MFGAQFRKILFGSVRIIFLALLLFVFGCFLYTLQFTENPVEEVLLFLRFGILAVAAKKSYTLHRQ